MHFFKILLLSQKYKRKFCQKNNDFFFVTLSILGTYWFQGHVDEIIPQLCRKRHTLNPELISNKRYQCDAAALFSESSLADCSWSISLITADSLQEEEEDPQDLCALRNLNKNTLAGASSHLQWSCVCRAGLRALHRRKHLCVLFVLCFQKVEVSLKQLQWFLQGSVGFCEAQKPFGWFINPGCCDSEGYKRFVCMLFQEGVT